jgi:predicted aminopeptidase
MNRLGPKAQRAFNRLEKKFWAAALVIILGLLNSACSPFYVLRAAYEEGKILWRRQPITALLEKPDLGQENRDKLRLVLAVREYARDRLKMNVGGSYASYSYVDRPDLSYILTAALRTEIRPYTWWFPIVGHVPYKGYFSKDAAHAAAQKLEAEGYDTHIRPSAAFSTLGWFDDPFLAHLLKYDQVALADIVFHELFHNTLYLKGAGNFNESVANFVGGRAAIEFFREQSGDSSPAYQTALRRWQEELEFSDFIEKLADSLADLYGKEIPDEEKLRLREGIFAQGKKEWDGRIANRPSHRFRGFSKQPINNAVLIHYILYLKNLKLFEELYQVKGKHLTSAIEAIREAVKDGGEPFEAVRGLLTGISP